MAGHDNRHIRVQLLENRLEIHKHILRRKEEIFGEHAAVLLRGRDVDVGIPLARRRAAYGDHERVALAVPGIERPARRRPGAGVGGIVRRLVKVVLRDHLRALRFENRPEIVRRLRVVPVQRAQSQLL